MTTKLVIDSNVFVSSFIAEEELHQTSLRFFTFLRSSLRPSSLLLPRIVMLEVVNSLYKKTGRFDEIQAFLHITDGDEQTQIFEFDQALQRSAYILLPKLRLKTLDFIVALSAISSRSTLISWDTALVKNCLPFIEAYTPGEFLKKYA